MLRFHIITLFPSFFDSALSTGLMGRALEKGLVHVNMIDPRQYASDRYRHVDDKPYGGSPGMVMQAAPLAAALRSIPVPGRMLAMAPSGRPASQKLVRELAAEADITLLCGRYEGFDARLFDRFPLEAVSIGDIVLNGGEAAALCLIEAVSRLVPGYMGHGESGDEESFSDGLLEYPHYTRPPLFENIPVPEVLLGGNHGEIAAWRRECAVALTLERRPEMLDQAPLTRADAVVVQKKRGPGIAPSVWLCLMDTRPAPAWQKTLHDTLSDEDVATLHELCGRLGLAGMRSIADAESLDRLLSEVGAAAGIEPILAALCPWSAKMQTLGAASLRQLAGTRPLVLLAGRHGYLEKAVTKRCPCYARLPRYACEGRFTGREMLTVLLDRLLGDYA